MQNGFNKPTEVTRIQFPSYGVCFSIHWNHTTPGRLLVEANQARHVWTRDDSLANTEPIPHRFVSVQIGRLHFDMTPLCTDSQILSESRCYCGLNHHRQFKQRWDKHVSALDAYDLDQTLVSKFRHLWKEWTSLVRKQR